MHLKTMIQLVCLSVLGVGGIARADTWSETDARTKWVSMGSLMYYTNEVEIGVPGILGTDFPEGQPGSLAAYAPDQRFTAYFSVETKLADAKKVLAQIEKQAPRKHSAFKPMTWKSKPGITFTGSQYTWSGRDDQNRAVPHLAGQGYLTNGSRVLIFSFDLQYPDGEVNTDSMLFPMFEYVAFGKQHPDR